MIKLFYQTASRLTGIAESAFVVYLRASGPENVGVGGELLEDFQKNRGSSIFLPIIRAAIFSLGRPL